MGKVTLDLTSEIEQGIEQISQRSGRPRDIVMQDALRSYVERQRQPIPRSVGIISDSEVHSGNIDEWLEANWLNHLLEEHGQQQAPPIMHEDDVEAQKRASQRGRPFFRSLGAADNPEVQAVDSEDWLKANWRPE